MRLATSPPGLHGKSPPKTVETFQFFAIEAPLLLVILAAVRGVVISDQHVLCCRNKNEKMQSLVKVWRPALERLLL